MRKLPTLAAESIKQQLDIVDVIGQYLPLRRSGSHRYLGCCPFHKEKTPSFTVHADRQFYHCFGCHTSGDVLKFVRDLEGLTFPKTLRHLSEQYSLQSVQRLTRRIDHRLTAVVRVKAELFRVGYSWSLERYLRLIKELRMLREPAPGELRIHQATTLLSRVRSWSTRDLAGFIDKYRKLKPSFVASCIQEVQEAEQELAWAITDRRRAA